MLSALALITHSGSIPIRNPRKVTSVIGWALSLKLREPGVGLSMFARSPVIKWAWRFP